MPETIRETVATTYHGDPDDLDRDRTRADRTEAPRARGHLAVSPMRLGLLFFDEQPEFDGGEARG